ALQLFYPQITQIVLVELKVKMQNAKVKMQKGPHKLHWGMCRPQLVLLSPNHKVPDAVIKVRSLWRIEADLLMDWNRFWVESAGRSAHAPAKCTHSEAAVKSPASTPCAWAARRREM